MRKIVRLCRNLRVNSAKRRIRSFFNAQVFAGIAAFARFEGGSKGANEHQCENGNKGLELFQHNIQLSYQK
jgi:hypothetical protein